MTQPNVRVTIDETPLDVPAGTTIMEAADKIGIQIPRLCYHPRLSALGSCRVCIVQVDGLDAFVASCCTTVAPNMVVRTASPAIRQARRDLIELLLDNHPKDCQTCERDGNCELQRLAYRHGVRERLFEGRRKHFEPDTDGTAVMREPDKCILCGRCVRVCREVQGVHNLSQHGRGFDTFVAPAHGGKMDESVCIQCGQCVNVCPTAAFLEKNSTNAVWAALSDPTKHVVVHTAPSIRAAVGEGFGLPIGTPATGQMITALRRLGFEAVFDTNIGADLTIVEESRELLRRLKGDGPLPLITSCSPGWISFLERFYPELIPHASTCKSPMSMLSTLLKTHYAKRIGKAPKDVFVVGVMPCTAKKYEATRPEHRLEDGSPTTDAVLTTRELIWMIKCYGIEFTALPEGQFDDPFGVSTGAGDIFGATGGVMEATLRTAAELATGMPANRLEFEEVRAVEGLREVKVLIGDTVLRTAIANGLTNAKRVLDRIVSKEATYEAIEIMACPGGCVGGGGQPYPPPGVDDLDEDLVRKRARALYTIDQSKSLRRSHESPAVKRLYEEFLGEPGGHTAHCLLHTHYAPKFPRGIR